MYTSFFGLRVAPFSVSPDPRFLYVTPGVKEALASLSYGLYNRKGIVLLTGEVGTGKTTIINKLLEWMHGLHFSTAFIFNPSLTVTQFLDVMMADFRIRCTSRDKGLRLLRLNEWLLVRHRAGRSVVVVVDEAQCLSTELLEELRLLTNMETFTQKLLQVVLCGQPELDAKLKDPQLRQLRQRIMVRCNTHPLSGEETQAYIRERLSRAGANGNPIFSDESIELIARYSRGIPRLVNLVCEQALIGSFADQQKVVSAATVQAVADRFELNGIPVFPAEKATIQTRIHGERLHAVANDDTGALSAETAFRHFGPRESMSRIHDALRRAERLDGADSSSSIEIPADSNAQSELADKALLSNTKRVPSNRATLAAAAAASPAAQPGIGSDATPAASVPGETDSSRLEDRTSSRRRSTSQLKEPAWTAPDLKTLFFLQPEHSYSTEREQFRTLRSRLYQIRGNQPIKTILITSPLRQEGKTFVAANLALAMGKQHEQNVLLVDADLRNPALRKLLGAPDSPGLVEYLSGEAELMSVIHKSPISNLFFVPAGKKTTNPGELIGNGHLPKLIESAAAMFDWIIVDSPPSVPVSDASLIAEGCDGVVLVIKASSTGFDVARKACSEFRRKPVLGVVLNGAGRSSDYVTYDHGRNSKSGAEENKG
jgi:general secretion pathway protein A